MHPEALKPYRKYRLTKNVSNPERDRRATDDVSRLPWTLGDVFRTEQLSEKRACCLHPVTIASSRYRPRGYIYGAHEGFTALVEGLEELPEDADDVMRSYNNEHVTISVLQHLVDSGYLTLEQLKVANAMFNHLTEDT